MEFELYLPLVMSYILGFPRDLKYLIFHSVVLTITIIIILNKYHQFRMQYKFISINFTREKHISFTAKNIEYNILGLLFKKISWGVFYLMSRLQKVDLVSFYFLFHFYFLLIYFLLFFYFYRTLGLGLKVISHAVTSVTSDGVIPTLIIGLKRKK